MTGDAFTAAAFPNDSQCLPRLDVKRYTVYGFYHSVFRVKVYTELLDLEQSGHGIDGMASLR